MGQFSARANNTDSSFSCVPKKNTWKLSQCGFEIAVFIFIHFFEFNLRTMYLCVRVYSKALHCVCIVFAFDTLLVFVLVFYMHSATVFSY